MNDKTKVWSDGRDRHADADDMMAALGDEEDLQVRSQERARGIEMTSNCKHCGRQCKLISPWAEVAMMFLGQVPQPPPWKPTMQGILVNIGCACGKATTMLTPWEEIRRWVDIGIRSGALDPAILTAAR